MKVLTRMRHHAPLSAEVTAFGTVTRSVPTDQIEFTDTGEGGRYRILTFRLTELSRADDL